MFKSILIIITIGAVSFLYTDIESSSTIYSAILPLVDFVDLFALAIWFVVLFNRHGISHTTRSSDFNSTALNNFNGFDGGEGGKGF